MNIQNSKYAEGVAFEKEGEVMVILKGMNVDVVTDGSEFDEYISGTVTHIGGNRIEIDGGEMIPLDDYIISITINQ